MTEDDKVFYLACAHITSKPGWTFNKALMKSKQDLGIKSVPAKQMSAKREEQVKRRTVNAR
jgi:hypothetical protein